MLNVVREQTADTIQDLRQRQDAAIAVLRATLTTNALPPVAPEREMPARDELRMVLDSAADVELAMLEIAQRGGELAAVVTSTWGESYLRARGVQRAPEAHGRVRNVALGANTQHSDPVVRRAANALFKLTDLEKARDATTYIANSGLEEADR
jgi:hypothetical protein